MDPFAGLLAVLVTPFTESGAVDEAALGGLAEFYIKKGARGLVVASLFGEGHLLSESERSRVARAVRVQIPPQMPLVVGCHGDTGACAQMAGEAARAGATAVLVPPPRGPNRTADALIRHARSIHESSGLPQVLLDYPPIGGELPVDQIAALCRAVPAVRAIKLEAPPTPTKVRALRALLGPRLSILTALGGVYAAHELAAGADGLMTGAAFPEYLAAMIAAKQRRSPELWRIYARALPLFRFEAQPGRGLALRKALLAWRGVLPGARLRRPAGEAGAPVYEDPRWMKEAARAMEDLAAFLPPSPLGPRRWESSDRATPVRRKMG